MISDFFSLLNKNIKLVIISMLLLVSIDSITWYKTVSFSATSATNNSSDVMFYMIMILFFKALGFIVAFMLTKKLFQKESLHSYGVSLWEMFVASLKATFDLIIYLLFVLLFLAILFQLTSSLTGIETLTNETISKIYKNHSTLMILVLVGVVLPLFIYSQMIFAFSFAQGINKFKIKRLVKKNIGKQYLNIVDKYFGNRFFNSFKMNKKYAKITFLYIGINVALLGVSYIALEYNPYLYSFMGNLTNSFIVVLYIFLIYFVYLNELPKDGILLNDWAKSIIETKVVK